MEQESSRHPMQIKTVFLAPPPLLCNMHRGLVSKHTPNSKHTPHHTKHRVRKTCSVRHRTHRGTHTITNVRHGIRSLRFRHLPFIRARSRAVSSWRAVHPKATEVGTRRFQGEAPGADGLLHDGYQPTQHAAGGIFNAVPSGWCRRQLPHPVW